VNHEKDLIMIINLKNYDLYFLRDITKQRNEKKHRFGSMTYGGKQGSARAHFIGLAGEYAVAKSIGVEIDTRIFDNHGDDGIDLPDGKWSVKTTTYLNDPYLRVEVHHFNENAQGYVLCAYNPEINLRLVEIVGWASKDKVKQAEKRFLRHGGPLNYILKKQKLKEWKIFNETI
jgi:hypothetical protein